MTRTRILAVLLLSLWAYPALAADRTWTAGSEVDDNWATVENWEGGNVAVDGDTIDISSNTHPDNIPDQSGWAAIDFNITNGVPSSLQYWLNGGTVGAVTVNHNSACIEITTNVAGSITVTDGALSADNAITISGDVTVSDSAAFQVRSGGFVTALGNITCSGGSILSVVGGTLDIATGKSLNGTASSIINYGTIEGVVNMTSATWSGTGTITVDETGTLDLGTDNDDDNSQTVDVNGAGKTITIGDDFRCLGFDGSAGTIVGGGYTITVGSGGLDYGAAVLDAPGTLNIAVAESCTIDWASSAASRLDTLTVAATKIATLADHTYIRALVVNGSVAFNSKNLYLAPVANSFWQGVGSMTGTGILVLEMTDDFSTAAQVNLGASGSTIIRAAATATLSGGIVCNNIDLGTDATPGELGLGGTSDIAGTLRRRAGGTSDANILTFAGNLTLRGNATLAGITADFGSARIDTGAVTIAGTNATAISNVGAIITGRTGAVTLTDLDTNWGSGGHIFARRWIDGTGNGVRVQTLAPHWMLGAR